VEEKQLMACSRGDAAPDQNTKYRLFAASGGYCQSPTCNRVLFIDTGSRRIHIAEIAHVFAANDDGPRADKELSEAERAEFGNLILLCSACHTMIDKAPEDFPDTVIKRWKRNHQARLAKVFGAVEYGSRAEVRAALEPLIAENRAIFEEYNPDLQYRENPESELAAAWQRNVRERIIPNSRRILAILDTNRKLLAGGEFRTLELFRQHVGDLELRHFTYEVVGAQRRFPEGMATIMRPG